jgi:hypothetical protein
MTSQRTTTEILTDLVSARAARMALANGERVEDVWRDGKRLRFTTMTLDEMQTLIAGLESEYAQAAAVEGGGRRRRAISLGYRN